MPIKNPDLSPLADRMRPLNFEEVLGQDHLIAPGKILRHTILTYQKGISNNLPSFILWGPPGTGKTTIARLVAHLTGNPFVVFSAVTSGIKEVKEVMKSAEDQWGMFHKITILFIDEIHRFNRSQQDAFLPYMEKGVISLIGATTENPSFELNSALLSRCSVYTLNQLTEEDIHKLIHRSITDVERGLGAMKITIEPEAIKTISALCNGDARTALNILELSVFMADLEEDQTRIINTEIIKKAIQKKVMVYDKSGEEHYNLISALHKSVRDSDPHGALYWLARMLESGEDPLYLARRIVRMSIEDIGTAAPNALAICIAAKDAVDFIGRPEGDLALAEAVVYLACSPKSNAVYSAYSKALKDVHEMPNLPVPLHLRNAPTRLMKNLNYGKDYKYAHNFEGHFVDQQHLPDNLVGRTYYEPDGQGYESEILKRMAQWNKLSKNKHEKDTP